MEVIAEKIRRKAAEALYKIGALRSNSKALPDPVAVYENSTGSFIFRYYPYHFILPELIKQDFVFNTEGIPVRYHLDPGDYINPLYPAYWGLIHCNQYDNAIDQDVALKTIVQMADFLLSVGRTKGNALRLEFTVDYPKEFLTAPWVSGLSQGVAASLFLRAYALTSKSDYYHAAVQCARVLVTPVSQGGCLNHIDGALPWIEEYPGMPTTHVLNGCLFGLIALFECGEHGATEFIEFAEQISQSVQVAYPQFRTKRFLKYDLRRKQLCNPHYMGLHVLLFYHLWQCSGRTQLYHMAHDLQKNTIWPLYMQSIHAVLSEKDKQWIHQHTQ